MRRAEYKFATLALSAGREGGGILILELYQKVRLLDVTKAKALHWALVAGQFGRDRVVLVAYDLW